MVELEVLVEEESAAEAVRVILARLLADDQVRFNVRKFQGKPDLLKKLPDRLRGYARACEKGQDIRVAVLVDRDTDDCSELKGRLDRIAADTGLAPRAHAGASGQFRVLNRIAVRELESWYFGDWPAVRKAFPKAPEEAPKRFRYGSPDIAHGKPSEAFEKILRTSGVRVVSKPEWARRVAPHIFETAEEAHAFVKNEPDDGKSTS
jgi:hypothetical protein